MRGWTWEGGVEVGQGGEGGGGGQGEALPSTLDWEEVVAGERQGRHHVVVRGGEGEPGQAACLAPPLKLLL